MVVNLLFRSTCSSKVTQTMQKRHYYIYMYVIPNISFEQIICVCAGRVKMETNFFKVKIYYACYYCKN